MQYLKRNESMLFALLNATSCVVSLLSVRHPLPSAEIAASTESELLIVV